MRHTCHAQNCKTPVPPKMFMCQPHWYMLPKATRDAIWATYRPGQEITKDLSMEYLNITMDAISWLADKEGLNQ